MKDPISIILVLGTALFFFYIALADPIHNAFDKLKQRLKAPSRRNKYWSRIEPYYRAYRKYPPDWQLRRALVYIRENGRCEHCGKLAGTISLSVKELWRNEYYLKNNVVRDAHIHHEIPFSKGGHHGFDNLHCLCLDCHDKEHPKGNLKKALEYSRKLSSLRLSRHSKVVTGRKKWFCQICSSGILSGQKYFGDTEYKVCMTCYKKHGKSIKKRIGNW